MGKQDSGELLVCIADVHTADGSVHTGELVFADSKIAKAVPANFVPAADRARLFDKDRTEEAPVEQATAAPGEKRTTRKSTAKK